METLLRRGAALLLSTVLGCTAAAPLPSVPAAPVAEAAAVPTADIAAPPPEARKGASAGAEAAGRLEAEDDGDQGAAHGMIGAAPRGMTLDKDRAAPGVVVPSTPPGPAPSVDTSFLAVSPDDPQWGASDAPVTLVEFADFECPFCGKVQQTLAELRRAYGPDRLRIVWKNNPLPFHPNARGTAELAMVVFQREGNDAFWAAHDTFFNGQRNLPDAYDEIVKRARLGASELDRLRAGGKAAAKIDLDMATAKAFGALGTPAFFINGVFLSGAQPLDRFTAVIDEQLKKAKAAAQAGTPANAVYQKLAKEQKQQQAANPPPAPRAAPVRDETTVHLAPIGNSPVRGKPTALVTIVEVADYQCPFCGRVEATLQQLATEYGDKIRVVWKDNPLPFHRRAEPAAQLAREARAQRGDAAFFQVHDALFADQQHLEDADLAAIATKVGLDVPRAMAAISNHTHQAALEADLDFADELDATGTPHFFINGRRLVGAQPIDKFRTIIDEEIVKAEAMIKAGTPAAKVYDKIQSRAVVKLPEKKKIPAPGKDSPGRGPASAKVVVQYFCDFQTIACTRLEPALAELEKAYPGKIRVVWRHRPLAFHGGAGLASQASMEAFRQKGSAGFWAMHDLLFASSGDPAALERPALEGYAVKLGLDLTQFQSALDTQAHKALVDADDKIAEGLGISALPAVVINGYYLPGVSRIGKLKKVVDLALSGK